MKRPLYRPFARLVQSPGSIADGVSFTFPVVSPFSRPDILRIDHVVWSVSNPAPGNGFLLDTNIEGLETLRGQWLGGQGATISVLPTFFDLPGNAQGTITITNNSGAGSTPAFGLFGHLLRSEEEEETYRPAPPFRAWAESAGRSLVAVAGTTALVPVLSFDAPLDPPGGILLTHMCIFGTGTIRHEMQIDGDGFANVPLFSIPTIGMYPLTGHLLPGKRYTFSVRRLTIGTSNVTLCLYGHGLSGEL